MKIIKLPSETTMHVNRSEHQLGVIYIIHKGRPHQRAKISGHRGEGIQKAILKAILKAIYSVSLLQKLHQEHVLKNYF